MVTRCRSARASRVSVASSANSDTSTRSRVKDCWSARLSSSSASVRSIARALTTYRRSMISSLPRARIVAGYVEQGLRDREWGAQFVGCVGREPALLGDVRLESREHGIEAVGEFTELVLTAFQLDPVRQRAAPGRASGVGDPVQRSEHPAGEQPSAEETEHQQKRQHHRRPRSEDAQELGPHGKHARSEGVGVDEECAVRNVTQEEHPHGEEQQHAGEHEKGGVAEGELEANAQPRCPIHDRRLRPR